MRIATKSVAPWLGIGALLNLTVPLASLAKIDNCLRLGYDFVCGGVESSVH